MRIVEGEAAASGRAVLSCGRERAAGGVTAILKTGARRYSVQNGTSILKGASQCGALFAAQGRSGFHRGLENSDLLRQWFFQFLAFPILRGRRQSREASQIGCKDGSSGCVVGRDALQATRDYLDAL